MTQKNLFIDAKKLTQWVIYFLWLQLVVAIMAIAADLMEYQVLYDYSNEIYASYEQILKEMDDSDNRQFIMGILYLIVFVISGFLILRWIHRMCHNAQQFGATNTQFTPGWSIGFYFVPFLNLWKPYQAMQEIFKVSKNPEGWFSEKEPSVFAMWWFLWLLNNFLGRFIYRESNKAEEISDFIHINTLTLASDVIDIFLVLSFLWIVKKVQVMQVERIAKLQALSSSKLDLEQSHDIVRV